MNYLFVTLLALCTLYAFWAGGWPERVGAAAYALSVAATHVILTAQHSRWLNVETGVFIVDAIVFLAFVAIALRADRYWPIWVSAFLGLGVLGHLGRLAGPDVLWWAYAVVLTIWSYPILALIALGSFLHRQKTTGTNPGRSWSSSSSRSDRAPPAGPTA